MPQQQPKPQKCPRCDGRKKYNHRPCALCHGTGKYPPKPMLFETLIHVAGTVFRAEGRIIQRCAICGVKLFDNYGAPPELGGQGKPKPAKTWVAGDFVEVLERVSDVPTKYVMVGHWNTDPPPENFCLELVEREDR